MVAGVDLRQDRVAWCKQFIPEGDFSLGDLRTCKLERQFDVVIVSEVLEHVSAVDRQMALANLSSHVKNGGWLIVTVPSAMYLRLEPIWELIRGWQYGVEGHDDELRHDLIDSVEMEADLKRAGCERDRSGTMCWGLIRWWIARKQ
jgi:trans-aconitate methyltransferase